MSKPCLGCQQKIAQQQPTRQWFPGLDQLDTALTVAYTEVPIEQRENIDLMRQLVQKIRSESPRPQRPQWNALLFVLDKKVLPYIDCKYCRMATYLHLGAGARPHIFFENGKYWDGFKLMLKLDILKYFWCMKAGYYRLILPKLKRNRK